jgi:hypothetical protein
MKSARLLWQLALVAVALFALLRVGAPLLGTMPRVITAEEADALLGAKHLSEQLASGEGSFKARLKAGFETTETQPRLTQLAPDRGPQRAAIEAPVPRWLGAIGIALAPASDTTTNLGRTGTAAALAITLALVLLAWHWRQRPLLAGVAIAIVLATPGVIDAAASAGHGASAILVMALTFVLLERALQTGSLLAIGGLGIAMGLTLGVHPMGLVMWVVALVAWAIRQRATTIGDTTGLRLPTVPLAMLLLPIVALVVLIAIWPALWNETGKRLGAWLLDYGSAQSAPHQVLGMGFEQASGRAAQAFTALLQWVAWTPVPVMALWVVGVATALREGRDGLWSPIVMVMAWLVVGALDGGLFGGRNSLLALLWVPTAVTAAQGVITTLAFVERRFGERMSPTARTALVLIVLLIAPVLQSARGTSLGLARSSGAELRTPIPTGIMAELASAHPMAVVDLGPRYIEWRPAFETLREGLMLDLREGNRREANVELVATPGEPTAPIPDAREVARDARPGLIVSLWQLDGPGRLDKPAALPHK